MCLYTKIQMYYFQTTNGQLIDKTSFTLADEGNGPFIQSWTNSIVPQPTTDQLNALNTLDQTLDQLYAACATDKDYLDSTDYLVTRVTEGYTLSDETKINREAARQRIRNLNSFKTSNGIN